jgi:hypothetical protein
MVALVVALGGATGDAGAEMGAGIGAPAAIPAGGVATEAPPVTMSPETSARRGLTSDEAGFPLDAAELTPPAGPGGRSVSITVRAMSGGVPCASAPGFFCCGPAPVGACSATLVGSAIAAAADLTAVAMGPATSRAGLGVATGGAAAGAEGATAGPVAAGSAPAGAPRLAKAAPQCWQKV